ncbi:DUF3810 domain-containing protein [Eubacteriales bacterium OttesenSCG-928-K08]|nr:DUF3810 domain-containing protein [Eubacteriales bacterium OttesenSCG-928-K08]
MANKPQSFEKSNGYKKELKRLLWLFLIIPIVLFNKLAPLIPETVEVLFSRGLFPAVSVVWNAIFGVFPFSFAELLLYCLVLGVPTLIIFSLVRAIKDKTRWAKFFHILISLLITACVAWNAFYLLWGLNYSRLTLDKTLSLNVKERPVDELEAACHALATTANALRVELAEDENGVFIYTAPIQDVFKSIPTAYRNLSAEFPMFDRYIAQPKKVFFSEGMSWMGISGIYIPFTAEANVNTHQPPLLIASSAAHESAHAMGIAREDEANFVSYLACTFLNDKAVNYSGVMLALINCGNQLYRADAQKYYALYETYSEAMHRDLSNYSLYWKAYEGPVQESMDRVNDSYLKHNNQESGIKSYGEMVDLLLAWFELQGLYS